MHAIELEKGEPQRELRVRLSLKPLCGRSAIGESPFPRPALVF